MDYAIIENLVQLEKLATPDPWIYESPKILRPGPDNGASQVVLSMPEEINGCSKQLDPDDARFIVQARNILPELLIYLEEISAERNEAINLLREVEMSLGPSPLQEKVHRFLNEIDS